MDQRYLKRANLFGAGALLWFILILRETVAIPSAFSPKQDFVRHAPGGEYSKKKDDSPTEVNKFQEPTNNIYGGRSRSLATETIFIRHVEILFKGMSQFFDDGARRAFEDATAMSLLSYMGHDRSNLALTVDAVEKGRDYVVCDFKITWEDTTISSPIDANMAPKEIIAKIFGDPSFIESYIRLLKISSPAEFQHISEIGLLKWTPNPTPSPSSSVRDLQCEGIFLEYYGINTLNEADRSVIKVLTEEFLTDELVNGLGYTGIGKLSLQFFFFDHFDNRLKVMLKVTASARSGIAISFKQTLVDIFIDQSDQYMSKLAVLQEKSIYFYKVDISDVFSETFLLLSSSIHNPKSSVLSPSHQTNIRISNKQTTMMTFPRPSPNSSGFPTKEPTACQDDITYRSPYGIQCRIHAFTGCSKMADIGFNKHQIVELMTRCKKSCGKCVLSTVPSSSSSRVPSTVSSVSSNFPNYLPSSAPSNIPTSRNFSRPPSNSSSNLSLKLSLEPSLQHSLEPSLKHSLEPQFMSLSKSPSVLASERIYALNSIRSQSMNETIDSISESNSRCYDDPSFTDKFGLSCELYRRVDCSRLDKIGFIKEEIHALKNACAESCGIEKCASINTNISKSEKPNTGAIISNHFPCKDELFIYSQQLGMTCKQFGILGCDKLEALGFAKEKVKKITTSCKFSCKMCSDHDTPSETQTIFPLQPSNKSQSVGNTTITNSLNKSKDIQLDSRTTSLPIEITENATTSNSSTKLKDIVLDNKNKETKAGENKLRGALIDMNEIYILEKDHKMKVTIFISVGVLMLFVTIGYMFKPVLEYSDECSSDGSFSEAKCQTHIDCKDESVCNAIEIVLDGD